ncbi:VOC family protein [Hymenobacter defluvii]|uniref:VOC family protein n=1 Tax=Hymenobacter defluvii TaxID=2054411 RepID=A0ABS3TH46_9BACT|nr:VOC family protein [Hymenobacter defluvii]MBO3271919.1 VOC family protein [Hymenobacter defluvii]
MNLKINHLQHVGIPVTDIESSEKFYQRLGFENVMTSTFKHDRDEGRVMMMQHGNMIIELYQMPEPELTEIRKRANGKIDHIAFDVDDIDETFATLKANGFRIVEEAPVYLGFWKNGCKYLNILGPDDERLEFCQIL